MKAFQDVFGLLNLPRWSIWPHWRLNWALRWIGHKSALIPGFRDFDVKERCSCGPFQILGRPLGLPYGLTYGLARSCNGH
jgi:hypothetical protein